MLAQMTPPPPPPRKPPPPPPRTNPGGPAAPAVRGARPVVAPLPTAGSWSNKLGIGLSDRSVVQENARGKPSGKPSRPDGGLTAKIRSKKEKKVQRIPPMLCRGEWEAAAKIGGAKDHYEMAEQFQFAISGDFEVLERKWMKEEASQKEIKKRLGQAGTVRVEAGRQAEMAEHPMKKDKAWANQGKMPKPPAGVLFRYLDKAKDDGKVMAMSAPSKAGIYEHLFMDQLDRRPLLSSSRGGGLNQKLFGAVPKSLPQAPKKKAAASGNKPNPPGGWSPPRPKSK